MCEPAFLGKEDRHAEIREIICNFVTMNKSLVQCLEDGSLEGHIRRQQLFISIYIYYMFYLLIYILLISISHSISCIFHSFIHS